MPSKATQPPLDRDALSRRLREIGSLQIQLTRIQADYQEAIDKIKAHYAPMIDRRQEQIDALAADLRLACEDSRVRLLPAGTKSLQVTYGSVGWRLQGDKVVLAAGQDQDAVCNRLDGLGHGDLIRRKQFVDKPAVKTAFDSGALTARALHAAGLQILPAGEDWWYETDKEAIRKELEG